MGDKMTLITRTILLTILFFIYPNNIVVGGVPPYSDPDEAKAVMAAEQAVKCICY